MSDTAYIQEVTRDNQLRVSLTMDSEEARAMAEIAAAAIDAALLLGGDLDAPVLKNAENVFRWANRAASTLERATGGAASGQE